VVIITIGHDYFSKSRIPKLFVLKFSKYAMDWVNNIGYP
jgi:hypothetical protein